MSVSQIKAKVLSDHFWIESNTPGIRIHVLRKWAEDQDVFDPNRTVLLVHGATFSSESLFDTPLLDGSFMDLLATRGNDVYAIDVRGYGQSDRPQEMLGDPTKSKPVSTIDVGVGDLRVAVREVLRRTGLKTVSLLGMSWGGSVAGAYAASEPSMLSKLVLIAPLWLLPGPSRVDPGGEIGAYRLIDVAAFGSRWLEAAPEHKRADLIPPGGFDKWVEVTLSTDSHCGKPGFIRAPSGPLLDIRRYWTAGNPAYDPEMIRCPTLLVHAEWDADTPFDCARDLFHRLTQTRYRRWVEIGEGTHMVLLEKNRMQVLEAVAAFLQENHTPES